MENVRGNDISMIFQEPMTSLNPLFTVGHQISEAIARAPGRVASARPCGWPWRCCAACRYRNPRSARTAYPHQMSGGMRQRVMIAMALSCNPQGADRRRADHGARRDDPGADPRPHARAAGRLGMAIILITHDMGVVAENADRVIVMYAGRKVEEAEVDDLFERPAHPYTRGLLGSHPPLTRRPGRAVARPPERDQGAWSRRSCTAPGLQLRAAMQLRNRPMPSGPSAARAASARPLGGLLARRATAGAGMNI